MTRAGLSEIQNIDIGEQVASYVDGKIESQRFRTAAEIGVGVRVRSDLDQPAVQQLAALAKPQRPINVVVHQCSVP